MEAHPENAPFIVLDSCSLQVPSALAVGASNQKGSDAVAQGVTDPEFQAQNGGSVAKNSSQGHTINPQRQDYPAATHRTIPVMPLGNGSQGQCAYVVIMSQRSGPGKTEPTTSASKAASGQPGAQTQRKFKGGSAVYEFRDGKQLVRVHHPTLTTAGAGVQGSAGRKSVAGAAETYRCNFCTYSSPKRYLLSRHMKSHSEERPHRCPVCERGFKTIASLQNHVNTHAGVRPHRCTDCGSCFTTSGELVRHVR